jgi:hypothetical protein
MITVVTGPPCSGKSTYVRDNCSAGDVVIDMDVLALALSVEGTEPFGYDDKVRRVAIAARGAAVKEALLVAQGERYFGVWIIHTDPSADVRASYRAMGGRIVEINPGKDVCIERLKFRPKQSQLVARKVIDEYYAKR